MSVPRKQALVTGGNRGIGLEICRQLAQAGVDVHLSAREIGKARIAAATLQGLPGSVFPLELDVSDEQSISRAVATLTERLPKLDVLINNAGILDQSDQGLDVPREAMLSSFSTNVLGPFLLSRSLASLLERSGDGQIINLTSGMSQISDLRLRRGLRQGTVAYRVSKLALNGVTMILSMELFARKIRVNAVCPGHVRTDMGGSSAPRSVEEGADTVVWLALGGAEDESGCMFRDRGVVEW